MGCCSNSQNQSQFLYELRYCETPRQNTKETLNQIEVFQKQLKQLEQIALSMKESINLNDFDEKEFYQASTIFLDRYLTYLKNAQEQKLLAESEILINLLNMRKFFQESLDDIKENLTGIEKELKPVLVNIIDYEQELGELGECRRLFKNEKNVIKLFSALTKLDQDTLEVHQVWLDQQITIYEKSILQFFNDKIQDFTQNLENAFTQLNISNYYQCVKEFAKCQKVLELEKIGIFLAEQVLWFKEQDTQQQFYSQFKLIAEKLEKTYMNSYQIFIINKLSSNLDQYLIKSEICLTSLLLIEKGLQYKSIEIFDEEFYSSQIHQAEICLQDLQELQTNFDSLFTKYQKLHLQQQKQQLIVIIQQLSPHYKACMKSISEKISENINNYFQMRNCIKAILSADKRKGQKVVVFLQNFGLKVQQDIKDIQINSKKYLDLQGLQIKQTQAELQTMISEYKGCFDEAFQYFSQTIQDQVNELEQSIKDCGQYTKEFLKQTEDKVFKINSSIKIASQIKLKDGNLLLNILFKLLDKQIFDSNKKRRANPLSELCNQIKLEMQGKSQSASRFGELNSSPQSQVFNNNVQSWKKVKRISLKLANVCQKCRQKKPQPNQQIQINQLKHDLCQTNYLLDLNAQVKCEKRTIASPKEKICKKKSIQQMEIVCQFCKIKYKLERFYDFMSNLLPGLDKNELPFEEAEMYKFYPFFYESMAKQYYKPNFETNQN